MLRYSEETNFEKWLSQCPLDPRALNYSVSRGGDGLLTVQCQWRMQASNSNYSPSRMPTSTVETAVAPAAADAAAPPATAANALTAASSDGNDPSPTSSDEAEKLKMMQAMMAKLSAAGIGPRAGAGAGAGSAMGGGGGAAMAMAMLSQQNAKDGAGEKPTREDIRAMMAMASGGGVRFPKPPGASFS